MSNNNIACVTCGDSKIIYPSLLAHLSIMEHNKNLDHYVFCADAKLPTDYMDRCASIELINVQDDETIKQIDSFDSFGRYSKFLFMRYLIPAYFHRLGYKYMIDIDYDILCLSEYNLEEILPSDNIFAYYPVGNISNACSLNVLNNICQVFNLDSDIVTKSLYPFGGFEVINLDKYISHNCAKLYTRIYKIVKNTNLRIPLNEFIVAVMTAKLESQPKVLPSTYNTNNLYPPRCAEPHNLHFASFLKPWNISEMLSSDYVKLDMRRSWITYLSYIYRYLLYAKKHNLLEKIAPETDIEKLIMEKSMQWETEYMNDSNEGHKMSDWNKIYDHKYFNQMNANSIITAKAMAPLIDTILPDVKSVIDLGCGCGAFIKEFQLLDKNILGLDIAEAAKNSLVIGDKYFSLHNISKPYKPDNEYDLAICMDTAQLFSPAEADIILDNLTNSAPLILFSSAIPGSGGRHHLNEQYPTYWREKFQARSFVGLDIIRPLVWNNPDIFWWYKQGIFLAIHTSRQELISRLENLPDFQFAPLIHPDMFAFKTEKK